MQYSTATESIEAVICDFMQCKLLSHKKDNIRIAQIKNSSAEWPVLIKNPLLDDWRNWTTRYSVPKKDDDYKWDFFNAVEKDLFDNFTYAFGTVSAIKQYFKSGKLTKNNFLTSGICYPVRKKDKNNFFQKLKKPVSNDSYWQTHWQPKAGIQYRIPDPNVQLVYAVCYGEVDAGEIPVNISISNTGKIEVY
jgi:hypothetical protein